MNKQNEFINDICEEYYCDEEFDDVDEEFYEFCKAIDDDEFGIYNPKDDTPKDENEQSQSKKRRMIIPISPIDDKMISEKKHQTELYKHEFIHNISWASFKKEVDENMVVIGRLTPKKQSQTVNLQNKKNFFFKNQPKIITNTKNKNKQICEHFIQNKCTSYKCNYAHHFNDMIICNCDFVKNIDAEIYINIGEEICPRRHYNECVESWILRQNRKFKNINFLFLHINPESIQNHLSVILKSSQNCKLQNLFIRKPQTTLKEYISQNSIDSGLSLSSEEDDEWL